MTSLAEKDFPVQQWCLKKLFTVFVGTFWGLFLFHCNYDIKEIHISSKFYPELLQWWSEVRSVFDSRRECQYILWNNKEIRVDNKPVFYEKNDIYDILNKISFS